MKQIHSTPTTPFATIIDQVINDAFPPSVLKFASKGIPEVYALRILETPLVYLLNERRAQERLTGDTPEEQYLHFLEDRINASTELQERFPNHWKRWQQVKK